MTTFRQDAAKRCACSLAMTAAALLAPSLAQAAVVKHHYTSLGGTNWAVDFSVVNDGAPAAFAGFTVYFTPGQFSNLALAGSPAGWDSIVVQPDSGIPAPGFFDTFALDSSDVPQFGATQGGFRVNFNWVGTSFDPGRLQFTLNDANFNVLAQGLTVPEPASALLALLALGALGWTQRRERTVSQSNLTEACA